MNIAAKCPGSTQKGYTLLELLIYVSVVGVLMTGVAMYMSTFVESRVKNQTIVEVTQQGSLVMDTIEQAVRQATSITAPASGASSNTSLTLVMPSGVENPTVIDLSSGALRVKRGTGAAIAVTNSKVTVTGLTFTNLTRSGTPGVVHVEFTVSRINSANRNEYDYQKKFYGSAALRKP